MLLVLFSIQKKYLVIAVDLQEKVLVWVIRSIEYTLLKKESSIMFYQNFYKLFRIIFLSSLLQ